MPNNYNQMKQSKLLKSKHALCQRWKKIKFLSEKKTCFINFQKLLNLQITKCRIVPKNLFFFVDQSSSYAFNALCTRCKKDILQR